MITLNALPVAIIGGGPVGLAAAAQLTSRKQRFVLFEAGSTIASNILSWKHVRVFSPWKYNIDKAARHLLQETKWLSPDDEALPTGQELYDRYLKPLSDHPRLRDNIYVNTKVLSVGRKNIDKMKTNGRAEAPYVIQVLGNNAVEQYEAKAVIDASGTWSSPNPIGSGGVYAVGEFDNQHRIFYGIPDIQHEHTQRYKNKSV
jgi:cation diffusion facilitator CzcD-associated flavoprotein CzcO